MTIFASIVAALVSKLQQAPAVSSSVFRARLRPLEKEKADALVVRVLESIPDRPMVGAAQVDWTTSVAIECYARSSGSSVSADVAVDSLLKSTYDRLASDWTLGGLAMDINPTGLAYDFDADGDITACATLTLNVRHLGPASTI